MNIQFGSGIVFVKPVAGNLPVNPSPFRLGVLQEVSINFKGDLKKLFGQNQFPVATARGKVNVDIKGKLAVFDPNMLNQIFFAQPSATGITNIADQEIHPFSGTPVTVTQSATFVSPGGDQGVQYADTGQQLLKVPSAPAAGQYSVVEATGIYTFAAGDSGRGNALISYLYTIAGRGTTITLQNQLMGYAPELAMFVYNNFRGKFLGLLLSDVTLAGIDIPSKLEDFWISSFDGSANATVNNSLGNLYLDNA